MVTSPHSFLLLSVFPTSINDTTIYLFHYEGEHLLTDPPPLLKPCPQPPVLFPFGPKYLSLPFYQEFWPGLSNDPQLFTQMSCSFSPGINLILVFLACDCMHASLPGQMVPAGGSQQSLSIFPSSAGAPLLDLADKYLSKRLELGVSTHTYNCQLSLH